jgi:hypothetical protein
MFWLDQFGEEVGAVKRSRQTRIKGQQLIEKEQIIYILLRIINYIVKIEKI